MHIDWFTVCAQAINFLILVWLMKRFLYKPIMKAIDAREKRIAAELANADAKKAEAQKEQEEFRQKNTDFDSQRDSMLTKATDEANAERTRLLDEARRVADELSAKRQESLQTEANNLNQAIINQTRQEVFAIARKVLADLSSTTLEAGIMEVFIRRLAEMQGKEKDDFTSALKSNTASSPAILRSAFELSEGQQASLRKALNDTFQADIQVRFETAPEQISGIELLTNGHKIAWSIDDYLTSLGGHVRALLSEKDKPVTPGEAKPEVLSTPPKEPS